MTDAQNLRRKVEMLARFPNIEENASSVMDFDDANERHVCPCGQVFKRDGARIVNHINTCPVVRAVLVGATLYQEAMLAAGKWRAANDWTGVLRDVTP